MLQCEDPEACNFKPAQDIVSFTHRHLGKAPIQPDDIKKIVVP